MRALVAYVLRVYIYQFQINESKTKLSQIACVNDSNQIKQRIWLVKQTIFKHLVYRKWVNIETLL